VLPAQEWTRFRGPNGTGISDAKTIPTEWKDADIRWKLKLPGSGHSSPVLWGEKLFITSAVTNGGERLLICVDTKSGKIAWTEEFPAGTHRIHAQNSFASSTAACDADHVYVAYATPAESNLVALDHAGNEKWRHKYGGYVSRHGFGSSPILYGELVFLANDQDGPSTVFAVDRMSGELKWKVERKVLPEQNASYATPLIYEPAGKPAELIVNSWAHGVTSFDPQNGKVNWERAVFERRPVGSPVVAAGLILGNCGEGGGANAIAALRPPQPGGEPEVVYTLDKSSAPYVPSLIAQGNLAYLWGDAGIITCINAADGKIVWRERLGGNYSGSPVIVDERLFCVSADGEVIVLATGEKSQVLAKNKLGELCRSTPAVANGQMFIRTEGHLFCIGGK